MKIAVIGSRGFPGVQGGVEKHCEKLYTHLAELGCDITVFSRRPYVDPDAHKYKGVSLIPLDCPQNKYLEALVHTFKSILNAKKLKPDILHLHAIGPSMFAFLAKAMKMKVVVTNHGPDYKRKKWPLPAKIFLRFSEMMGVKFADGVIAIAKTISDDMRLKYGVKAVIIPNGVEIHKKIETDFILKKFGLEKKKYIFSVGRLVPEKGFDYLIDAFGMIQDKEWRLVIAGEADHEDSYSRDLKKKAGGNDKVILTGFLTGLSLQELYSHAGFFVLPSYYEGMPIALLEAMSYGLSCVASDIPANKNIDLSDERFFKTGDSKLLSEKIQEFIHSPWEEKDMAEQIGVISEKYSWEKIAEETLECYRNVMAGA